MCHAKNLSHTQYTQTCRPAIKPSVCRWKSCQTHSARLSREEHSTSTIQFRIQEDLKCVALSNLIIPSHVVQILMWSFEPSLCCVYYFHLQRQDTSTNPGAWVICELRGFVHFRVKHLSTNFLKPAATASINTCKYKCIFFPRMCLDVCLRRLIISTASWFWIWIKREDNDSFFLTKKKTCS